MATTNWNTKLAEMAEEKGISIKDVVKQFGHRSTPYRHLGGSRGLSVDAARIWAKALGMTTDELLDALGKEHTSTN